MPAYAVGNLRPPAHIPEDVLNYIERIQATLDPFGGRFLVHGASQREVREGTWPGALVVIAFPSLPDARAWYDSAAYQELLPLCTRHMDGDVLLIDGVAPGYDPAATATALRTVSVGSRSSVAPCQCSSPGGQVTVSPGWASKTVPSRVPIRAMPATTWRVWPTAWWCQAVWAPGEKRTMLARIRDGSVPA